MAYHVSKARFEQLVERALAELPERFAEFLEEVPIEIRARPTRRQLESVGLDEDHLLLGLYDGLPLTQRSVEHSGVRPAVIYVFKEDIEDASGSEADLVEHVRTTVEERGVALRERSRQLDVLAHAARVEHLLRLAADDPGIGVPRDAAAHEQARSVGDVLLRRTRLGLLCGRELAPAGAAGPAAVAQTLGPELGWDEPEVRAQAEHAWWAAL